MGITWQGKGRLTHRETCTQLNWGTNRSGWRGAKSDHVGAGGRELNTVHSERGAKSTPRVKGRENACGQSYPHLGLETKKGGGVDMFTSCLWHILKEVLTRQVDEGIPRP